MNHKQTRKSVPVLILLVVAVLVTSKPASAQFGGVTYCSNCSTFMDQLTQEVYENGTMIQTAQSLATQLQALQYQIQMMAATPYQVFSQVGSILNQLQQVSQGGYAISTAMANMDNQFDSNYAYLGQDQTTAFANRYAQWSSTTRDTTQKTLDVARQASQNQENEASNIQTLQEEAQSADAAVSTVQVGNQIAAEILNQLMELRQIMTADVTAKAAFQAQQVKEQDETAALQGFVQTSGPSLSTLTNGVAQDGTPTNMDSGDNY